MAFKTIDIKKIAEKLDVNITEIEQKQKLIDRIIKLRHEMGLSQSDLASILGVSQSRIAQIESGFSTGKISFDILLNTINALGFDYEFRIRKVA